MEAEGGGGEKKWRTGKDTNNVEIMRRQKQKIMPCIFACILDDKNQAGPFRHRFIEL